MDSSRRQQPLLLTSTTDGSTIPNIFADGYDSRAR
ncbi:hypothetical protein Lser_V15G36249 [Lactuca serriola]